MLETIIELTTTASAVIAVGISSYVLRLQLRDRQEVRHERERENAIRVNCWADWSPDEVQLLSGAVLRDPIVSVANRTDEPVYGAFIDYRDQMDAHPIRVDVGTVPPGSTRSVRIDIGQSGLPAHWQPEHLLPALYFRDTQNRWWHRNTAGYLKPDPGPGNDDFFESGGTFASAAGAQANRPATGARSV